MATKQAKQAVERKPRDKAPTNESKADKFKRLAQKRVTKALNAIRGLGNLGGSGYESTPEQREKIEVALGHAVEDALASLNRVKSAKEQFTL